MEPFAAKACGLKSSAPSLPTVTRTDARLLSACLLALAACSPLKQLPPATPQAASAAHHNPEAAVAWQAKPGWHHQHSAVAAAHPLAAAAGQEILNAGGSAMDAGIAVQLVLSLVEPQSSGIGGGAFLMYWDGQTVSAVDGRETAPAAADEGLFLKPDGKPMAYLQAVVGGRAVGTPGLLRMLELAHARFGKLPWARLFEPAIRLSEQGYALTARSVGLLKQDRALSKDPQAAAYFYDAQGQLWPAGHPLRNPALAAVLRQVAQGGADAFLTGPVARDIVRRVREYRGNPGLLSEADLAAYTPKFRQALCSDWRQTWRVCGFPPPSSGHLTVMQILGMLPEQNAAQALSGGLPHAGWLHRYAEASNLAFADRAHYIADPDFVAAPAADWLSLLAPEYLRSRAKLIGEKAAGEAQPGRPMGSAIAWASQAEQPEYGTSHISIVDGEGRALAMTTSIESGFGARIMSDGGTGLAGGFLLNNQLTDFALAPRDAQGRPVANRVEPGKRPRSSMSPTLVFERRAGRDDQLLMSLGAPGGPAIIHYVAKTLIATHDWGLDVQQAVALPNFGSFNSGPVFLEEGLFPASTMAGLRAYGQRVLETDLPSGIQAIERRGTAWFGAADPRRDGVVRGN